MADAALDVKDVQPLEINFDAIMGKDLAAPEGAASKALETVDLSAPSALKTFSARSKCSPEQLTQIKAYSTQHVQTMIDDRAQFSTFGTTVFDGINQVVNDMLKLQGSDEVSEETLRILKEMEHVLAGFKKDYNTEDSRVAEMFRSISEFVKGAANALSFGKQIALDFFNRSLEAGERLDRIAGKLVTHRETMKTNVISCDELYDANEGSIVNVIGVIAIMEQLRDDAHAISQQLDAEAKALPAESPDRRAKEEARANTVEFITDADMKISEFIQRLFIAYATSPQIRNIRRVSYGLQQRIQLLIDLTIPVMKMTIAVQGNLLRAKTAGEAGDAVIDANKQALQEFSKVAGETIPVLAQTMFKPSLDAETVMAIADSIDSQNKGLVAATEQAMEHRAVLTDTIVRATTLINESGEAADAKIIELVSRSRQPIAALPAPEVPKDIMDLTKGTTS
jgi:uncharacterized protein YaaN involved in tellurite resistance